MNSDMGQQKVYVDIEEEITNVVEHLRHVRSNDVVLVVPQHALLLQSVVNLKLLAQEAKKMNKNITIMTKDPDGAAFAQRAGILTQSYISDEEEQYHGSYVRPVGAAHAQDGQSMQQRNNAVPTKTSTTQMHKELDYKRTLPNNNNVGGIRRVDNSIKNNTPSQQQMSSQSQSMQGMGNDHGIAQYEKSLEQARVVNAPQYVQPQSQQRTVGTTIHPTQQKESFSQPTIYQRSSQMKSKKHQKNVSHVSEGARFAMKGFVSVGIVLVVVILLIAILPKTQVNVTPKNVHIDENMEMTARSDQSVYDEDRRLIPARLIERDVTFTKTFPSTGSGDVEAQKAQGTITIYNEYNESPQSLVATTRFLAEDGTLFRLVKQTTVPGMRDGEPGKVEALVIADQEGTEGNIDPTRFSVPGFDGSPKKDKFYGISEKTMTGGGSGGVGVALVTQEDIDSAEKTMNDELSGYIEEQVNGMLRPESEILLSEALMSEILRSEASVSEGTMGENFMYEIVSHVKALVFAQGDVLAVMEASVDSEMHQYDIEQMELVLAYDVVEVDFENETLKMKVRGTADIVVVVDIASFKKDILGKKHDDLLAIIEGDYENEIEKITIESVVPGVPAFIANRISRLGFMTDVFVEE